MPEFTKGKWWIAPPMFDGDAIFAPPSEEGRRGEVVAMGILNKADARLIAEAPIMYHLLEDFVNLDIATDNIKYQVLLLQTVAAEVLNNINRKDTGHDKQPPKQR